MNTNQAKAPQSGADRFDLFFSNIPDRGLVGSYATIDDAKAAGRKHFFEFHVIHQGRLVGHWETFGGWRDR